MCVTTYYISGFWRLSKTYSQQLSVQMLRWIMQKWTKYQDQSTVNQKLPKSGIYLRIKGLRYQKSQNIMCVHWMIRKISNNFLTTIDWQRTSQPHLIITFKKNYLIIIITQSNQKYELSVVLWKLEGKLKISERQRSPN